MDGVSWGKAWEVRYFDVFFFSGRDVNSMVWKEHPDCTEACGSTVEGATHLSTNLGKD